MKLHNITYGASSCACVRGTYGAVERFESAGLSILFKFVGGARAVDVHERVVVGGILSILV